MLTMKTEFLLNGGWRNGRVKIKIMCCILPHLKAATGRALRGELEMFGELDVEGRNLTAVLVRAFIGVIETLARSIAT